MKNHITIDVRTNVCKKDKTIENLILHGIPWPRYASYKAYEYARFVLKKRWPQAEKLILNCPESAYLYARHVMKKRWKEAEPVVIKQNKSAYSYAKYVVKGRFEKAEKNIHSTKKYDHSYYSYLYAKYIQIGRAHV